VSAPPDDTTAPTSQEDPIRRPRRHQPSERRRDPGLFAAVRETVIVVVLALALSLLVKPVLVLSFPFDSV